MTHVVAALYKFVELPDFAELRDPLLAHCLSQSIKGTLLLAREGINGTIAGPRPAINSVLAFLRADLRLADLQVRESLAERPPFDRMKVRLKQEIVSFGVLEANPAQQVGTYVQPQDWNALIADPDVVVIDTRNQYEVQIGTFAGARNPQLNSFRQFPHYVEAQLDPNTHTKVAMFCTGGIRCEKASSYLLAQGFQEVYQLQGGILNYLETVPADDSLWQGECFVFDQRVAVTHGLATGSYSMCTACGHPISEQDKTSVHYQENVACPYCVDCPLSEQIRQPAAG